ELAYDEETNEIVAPTFRQDIHSTADLAEEVARFYGYDAVPSTLPTGAATMGGKSKKRRIEEIAQQTAQYCGFSEGMSYSFESPKVFDKLLIPQDSKLRDAIVISNPLGEDFSIMRTISLNGMLSSLAFNQNHRNKDVRLYELGNIYLPEKLPLDKLPDERMQLTLGMYGEGDFFTLKGVIEEFFERAGLRGETKWDPADKKPFLHPGRQADIVYEGIKVGYIGEVHPAVMDNYGLSEKTYVAVLDMPLITEKAGFDRKYVGIARFPAVTRDISMLVPKNILAGTVEDMIRQRGGKMLESCSLFDLYEGVQVKPGHKSMAYSLSFRSPDKTLGDQEVGAAMKKIWNGLESLGIEIRS
nr:phenylalanine--tRNA ligase subunit beta [Lachnospiraceae bacterium]